MFVTQHLAKVNKTQPKFQILIYPWTQLYNFLLPSHQYYETRGFIAHLGVSNGACLLLLLGITKNITQEMENIFNLNYHTLLVDDLNLRKQYQSYLDINLIPDEYKQGKSYYNDYKNEIYPKVLDELHILKRDKNLANKIKQKLLSPEASPGLAPDELLKLLPKAYFVIFEWDILKDQGLLYAQRLKASGVPVKINYYENAYHGMIPFIDETTGYTMARNVYQDMIKYIKENI